MQVIHTNLARRVSHYKSQTLCHCNMQQHTLPPIYVSDTVPLQYATTHTASTTNHFLWSVAVGRLRSNQNVIKLWAGWRWKRTMRAGLLHYYNMYVNCLHTCVWWGSGTGGRSTGRTLANWWTWQTPGQMRPSRGPEDTWETSGAENSRRLVERITQGRLVVLMTEGD